MIQSLNIVWIGNFVEYIRRFVSYLLKEDQEREVKFYLLAF